MGQDERLDPQSQTGDQADSWSEYKRLVLAELVRLNDCVEKLRDEHSSFRHEELSQRVSRIYKVVQDAIKESDAKVLDKVGRDMDIIRRQIQELDDFKKQLDRFDVKKKIGEIEEILEREGMHKRRKGKLELWTAIITIVGSLTISIISLIISLL